MKCVIISGLLIHLSDNILPFLDKKTDLYVHTYNTPDNIRWITKLNRYRRYVNSLYVDVEDVKFENKLYSYFYSTYRVVNNIKDIDQYTKIFKFKPNVDGDISYVGDTEYYFRKGYLQSQPLLDKYTKEDCLYGSIYFKTIDERIFSGYTVGFKKMFHILKEEFIKKMYTLDSLCKNNYGERYEGSIFWTKWAEQCNVPLIQDIDLKIPNSKQWQH